MSKFALIYSLNKNLLWQAVEVFHQCLHLNPNPHSNNCIHLGNSPHRRNNRQHLSLQFPHMALALKVGSMQINDIYKDSFTIKSIFSNKKHYFKNLQFEVDGHSTSCPLCALSNFLVINFKAKICSLISTSGRLMSTRTSGLRS